MDRKLGRGAGSCGAGSEVAAAARRNGMGHVALPAEGTCMLLQEARTWPLRDPRQ